ncbi:protein translocase subunit SecD [Candidatus Fermentibacteria bacterium]|nr:protein translocase subunit SecD [Candidatus Fermentibacteria bacterium]
MKKGLVWRLVVVAAVLVAAIIILIPTFRFYRLSPSQREEMAPSRLARLRAKALHLGLDLRGGTHLVLEVDQRNLTEDQRKDAAERAMETIRNRIDEFGVAEPIVQRQGENRIVVQLPGVDAARAKELVRRTAFLEFRLVEDPVNVQAAIQRMDEVASHMEVDLSDAASPERPEGTIEGLFDEPGDSTDVPGVTADMKLKHPLASRIYIVDNGVCSVPTDEEPVVRRFLSEPSVQRVLGRDIGFVWGQTFTDARGGSYRHLYLLKSEPKVTGEALSNAQMGVDYDSGTPAVDFFLNRRGGRRFGAITKENVGKLLAIVLDNVVQSAPRINSEIRTRGQITGSFTENEARDLAVVLRTGALPAPVIISEERTVGPSLGEDSIRRGLRAGLVGLALVVAFMLVYYKAAGLLATGALSLNILLLIAGLALFGATLTLPGIAGIVLTIGMAVDANVLIYERLREELRSGKTVAASIAAGYSRAFLTILDSNVTTLLTALILLQFGSGPIKGFAVTLSLGIVFSMFTALFVTRLVYDLVMSRWPLTKLSI